jgi:RNA polymerase sigma factor (sigma-70 family)
MTDENGRRGGAGPSDSGPSDSEAAEAARALTRDLDSGFAEVVRQHRDLLYSVARSFVRDSADAEDLAAEVLLRAYRALCGYSTERIEALAVRPWLLTILRNTARNRARDVARRPGPPSAFEPVDDPSPEPGPAEQAERGELQRMLGTALGELPEVQQTAVVLRHVQGLRTSEVAQVLGCKEGTAKSHISRGLVRLRTLLGDEHPATTDPDPARPPGPDPVHPLGLAQTTRMAAPLGGRTR